MSRALQGRLSRVAARVDPSTVPSAEESLFALERLDAPPAGYTESARRRDEATLHRFAEAALACGLITPEELAEAGQIKE